MTDITNPQHSTTFAEFAEEALDFARREFAQRFLPTLGQCVMDDPSLAPRIHALLDAFDQQPQDLRTRATRALLQVILTCGITNEAVASEELR